MPIPRNIHVDAGSPSAEPPDGKGGFTPLGVERPGPLVRERPAGDEPYLRFAGPGDFECFVGLACIKRMAGWGREAGRDEVIGRLAGRTCRDSKGTYVLVQDAAVNRNARGGFASIVADCDAQEKGRHDFERECRPFDCVGWWHTHPGGIGLFYSPTDRDNQSTWTDPNSIGIVLNPDLRGDALKLFRGPASVELRAMTDLAAIREGSMTHARPSSPVAPRGTQFSAAWHLPTSGACRMHVRIPPSTGMTVALCIASAALLFALVTHILVCLSLPRNTDNTASGYREGPRTYPQAIPPSVPTTMRSRDATTYGRTGG